MSRRLRIFAVFVCVALSEALAQAVVPVSVYPDPIQFGTVALNSASFPLGIYLSNTSTSAVTITSTTITGTNGANFAFNGYSCVGTISAGQTCEFTMTFTPSALGNATASLVIAETGLTTAITIPLQGTGGNPIPTITSLSPASVYVNSPTTTVTINGSGFLSSSVVYAQNGVLVPTTFVSASQLKAQIPDTLLTNESGVSVYVANTSPGGGSSISVTLQVVGLEPSISSATPASIVAGTASEPILINGQNFASGAQAQWNGTSIPATYISSSQLQIQPTTAELATAGLIQLAVSNPSPGTLSAPITFDLTYPVSVKVLDLPASNLVWDPFAQLIYASLPSSAGTNGNSIAVINPSTGVVTGYYFAGSEPTQLALDSTSKYLYVGLNGSGSIQKLDLPAFTHDIEINLGHSTNGLTLAAALAVSPANSTTIAVELSNSSCCGDGPLEFFTGTTKLANSVASPAMTQLAFASGTTLYGYTSGTLSQVAVSSTGGTLTQSWSDLVTGNTFDYSGGLIFGGNGQEFNPSSGLLLGTFDVGNSCCCCGGIEVLPNSAINRAFALGQTPFFNGFGITSYNLTEFTPLAVANLSELNSPYNNSTLSNFIQWGPSGLAFIVTSGCCSTPSTSQIVLVQSPTLLLTATKTVSPVPVSTSSSPATTTHGAANFRMALKGSGFVPGSVVTWNGKAHSASYVNEHEMTVYVRAADVATAGTADVVVKNPTPGGGKSNTLTFPIK